MAENLEAAGATRSNPAYVTPFLMGSPGNCHIIEETGLHLIYLQYPDLASSKSLALPNPLYPTSTLYMNQIYGGGGS